MTDAAIGRVRGGRRKRQTSKEIVMARELMCRCTRCGKSTPDSNTTVIDGRGYCEDCVEARADDEHLEACDTLEHELTGE